MKTLYSTDTSDIALLEIFPSEEDRLHSNQDNFITKRFRFPNLEHRGIVSQPHGKKFHPQRGLICRKAAHRDQNV